MTSPFPEIVAALEAAAETTRLRLLALLVESELTVSELMAILGQSQPRISRHLRLLVDGGLVERRREGAWGFFRVADHGAPSALVRDIVARVAPEDSTCASDRARLSDVRRARGAQAARYFADHARDWDTIRALHVSEDVVETAIRKAVGPGPLRAALDLGAGTGRMLELLAPVAQRVIGVDQSPAMLNIARARIERVGLRNVQLRQGDIYAPPVERDGHDLVVIHQVLHYLDDPARATREAARALRPGGRIVIVDFAPHENEFLRQRHAHRRLGFSVDEVAGFLRDAGLDDVAHQAAPAGEADKLKVSLWTARDPRLLADAPLTVREVA